MTEKHKALKFFEAGTKLIPVITLMIGAVSSGLGAWVSLKSEIESLRNDVVMVRRDHDEQKRLMERHIDGFDHDAWFDASGIRHPTLRSCLNNWYIEKLAEDEHEDDAKYANRADIEQWRQRLLELNPTLVRPGR